MTPCKLNLKTFFFLQNFQRANAKVQNSLHLHNWKQFKIILTSTFFFHLHFKMRFLHFHVIYTFVSITLVKYVLLDSLNLSLENWIELWLATDYFDTFQTQRRVRVRGKMNKDFFSQRGRFTQGEFFSGINYFLILISIKSLPAKTKY